MTDPRPRTLSSSGSRPAEAAGLHRDLRLPDLVAMQVLLVFGATWVGTAARVGSGHLLLWLAAILTLFLPIALVVGFCAGIWPEEGGVYQWTKHAIGPFAGFFSAWNFGMWAILTVAGLGIQIATTLHYALGPSAAWMETSRPFVTMLSFVILLVSLGINLVGLRYGRWVAHFGTTITLAVVALGAMLLWYHPGATPLHPHIAPQPAFAFSLPPMTLFTITIFSKLSFYGLCGLEQIAIFAGEMRDPRRNITRSAWIAAPVIALLYIVTTGALLSYTPAAKIDLTGPIPQLLGTAFGANAGMGQITSLVVNFAFAAFLVAQYATIIAETSRLPMVAAWDHLFPRAFLTLSPRFGTPVVAVVVVVGIAFLLALFALWGTSGDEAFQIVSSAANACFAIYYVVLLLVPLLAGTRASRRPDLRPGSLLRLAACSAMAVTLLSFGLNLNPIVAVRSNLIFALKIILPVVLLNGFGIYLFRRGARRAVRP